MNTQNTTKTCADCLFCLPCHDPDHVCPPTAAFCDCPTSAGGDGICYAIHSDFNICQNFQPKNTTQNV